MVSGRNPRGPRRRWVTRLPTSGMPVTVHDRRSFLGLLAKATAGAAAITTIPTVLYEERWVQAASAQTVPTVEATFVALVETVNDAAGEDVAAATGIWVMTEFDKALPPLPEGSPSAAVAAVLDAYAAQTGNGPTFATTSHEGRLAALEAMVKDPQPAIRQIANQVLPFAAFAYWGDASLDEPAQPGGERPPHWDLAGFSGPSHGRLDHYQDGLPPDFAASWDPDGWQPDGAA